MCRSGKKEWKEEQGREKWEEEVREVRKGEGEEGGLRREREGERCGGKDE